MNHPRRNIMGSGGNLPKYLGGFQAGRTIQEHSIDGIAPFGQNKFHRCSKSVSHDKMHKKVIKFLAPTKFRMEPVLFVKSQGSVSGPFLFFIPTPNRIKRHLNTINLSWSAWKSHGFILTLSYFYWEPQKTSRYTYKWLLPCILALSKENENQLSISWNYNEPKSASPKMKYFSNNKVLYKFTLLSLLT